MAKILVTGSADGLGKLAATQLIAMGHQVVLHTRNAQRADEIAKKVKGAADILIADLSSMEETQALAEKANAWGTFDAVIHNAGIYKVEKNSLSIDGLPLLFAVNSLAPYMLTALILKPERLIYLSSDMHFQGNYHLDPILATKEIDVTYSDTKLHDLILSMATARKWPDVYSNAVDPGWVPTKMGGAGAPDNLEKGYETQVWLSASAKPDATVSGQYFHHKKRTHYSQIAKDVAMQKQFLAYCEKITGVSLK